MEETMEGVKNAAKGIDFNDLQGSIKNAANNLQDGIGSGLSTMNSAGSEFVSDLNSALDDAIPTAINTDITSSASGPYVLNYENQWGWITLYVVTIVIAILGNLLFIISALCTKRTRTTGYYLLINLSIRDILLASLCIPFTLDSEIIAYTWNYSDIFCKCYRYFYYCFLFFLPLTLLFLAWHLFVENCKWNFAGEEGVVPRPWPHTIFIPLIWFFSALFAIPTVFYSQVQEEKNDFYGNEIAARDDATAKVCMHATGDDWIHGSYFFYFTSILLTFVLPLILLFIPWWALLVQICGCCTRKLRSSEFWLSLITIFMILFYEASRAPFELFNIHHVIINWDVLGAWAPSSTFIPNIDSQPYIATMKWAVYAPALLHPLLYFTFSPEARHGLCILFSRLCSCCCSKADRDVEVASDDEKGRMLGKENNVDHHSANNIEAGGANPADVPLQSKQEEEM